MGRRMSTNLSDASPLRPHQPDSKEVTSLDNDDFMLEGSVDQESMPSQLKRSNISYKGKTVDLSGKYRANYDRRFLRSYQAQQAFVDLFTRDAAFLRGSDIPAEPESSRSVDDSNVSIPEPNIDYS